MQALYRKQRVLITGIVEIQRAVILSYAAILRSQALLQAKLPDTFLGRRQHSLLPHPQEKVRLKRTTTDAR